MGRPDIVMGRPVAVDIAYEPIEAEESTTVGVLDVEVPTRDKLQEWYLEIHDVQTGTLVTALEILSPFNKLHAKGREDYVKKRKRIFGSMTNLVEIDLLAPTSRCLSIASRLAPITGYWSVAGRLIPRRSCTPSTFGSQFP